MMKILIFIFLICHVNFLKCIDLPKSLQCVDDSCDEQISTGRVLGVSKPIHGNLGLLKASSKIKIRGKNATPENTLWLIEQGGNYGFLDLSHIKENVNNVNSDLTLVRNPYYKKTIDETEDDEDNANETKLFSKGTPIKTNDISSENDETENSNEGDNSQNEKTTGIISETGTSSFSSTDKISDSLKSDSDNKSVKNDINNNSEPVNSLKSQIGKNENDSENDTAIKNVKEAQESKDSKNVLENKEKIIETTSNLEIPKNAVQEEVKHSSENVNVENQDKNKENLKFQIQDIKHEEIKESKQNILQNKDIVKDDPINKQVQITKSNDETVNNEENHSEGNVSQNAQTSPTPIKSTETNVNTQENNKSDLKSENQLTNKSTESSNSKTQLPNEKLENIESGEQKKLISVNPNESIQNSVENPQIKDNKLQNDKPVENVNEKNVEIQHGTSNNPVPNRSETVNTNEKLTKISPEIDNSKTTENEKPDKVVDNSKNLENIPKESIKSVNTDSQSDSVHSKENENINQSNISLINQENISKPITNEEKLHQKSENMVLESIGSDFVEKQGNVKQTEEISVGKEQENRENEASLESGKEEPEKISEPIIPDASKASKKPDNHVPIKESVDNDPWFQNNGKPSLDNEKEVLNQIKSPFIKLMMKLDHVSQIIIKSITLKLGFDSSSKFSQFTNYWFQMSLENFVSIFLLFSVLFLIVYTPKLLKFNRDWKSEFLKQSQLIKELESKLQSIEEVRHKLTVQNHNFEKVIDEYKQQINEIQEDAGKNKKALLLEVEKIKKTNESNIKNVTTDLNNKIQQCQMLENDIVNKTAIIDNLEEEKKQMEISIENDKSEFERRLLENKRELNRMSNSNEQMKHLLEQSSLENDQLREKLQELTENLIDKNQALSQLENSFEQLKLFEGLDFEEFNEKKAIYLDLTNTKHQLESAEQNIEQLNQELNTKSDLIIQLEEDKSEMSRKMIDFENQKAEAVNQKEAAEMKLNVLSEYFKSKEVEMAKTLGHQVIESTQSMDQVDFLKHRIRILETENDDMLKTIQRLKLEVKEAQTFAVKCKGDANEEINKLFLKCSNLERSLFTESDENKKLRIKLSRYCGPTPPRNQSSTLNHNTKDRPPSRQSGFSDSLGTFAPLPFIPFTPQSPTPNNSQYSGRNSVNSKKSNNT